MNDQLDVMKPERSIKLFQSSQHASNTDTHTPNASEMSTNQSSDGTVVKLSQELKEACFDAARIDVREKPRDNDISNALHKTYISVVDALSLTSVQHTKTQSHYAVIPPPTKERVSTYGLSTWRVELCGLGRGNETLRFDILDDVIIGRGSQADIKLDSYHAAYQGVSRRHAMLRPTNLRLYLIDLGSTNGTFLNSVPLSYAATRPIRHNDMITVGKLSFALKVVESP